MLQSPNQEKKLSFNFFFKLRNYFCQRLLLEKEKFKAKVFTEIENYLNQRLDVTYYLKNLVKFEKICGMHLNKIQNMSMEYIGKEDIFNLVQSKEENDSLTKNKINSINAVDRSIEDINKFQIIKYFNGRLKNNSMTDIDRQILLFIDDDLKYKINHKANEDLNRFEVLQQQ